MGLDELIPETAGTSSSSSGGRRGATIDTGEDFVKEFSCKRGTKKFTESQWDKIKKVIREETDYSSVGEVESLPARERHTVLHELAIEALVDGKEGDIPRSDERCVVCGKDCSTNYVKLEGEKVHPQHPIAKLANELELETGTVSLDDENRSN